MKTSHFTSFALASFLAVVQGVELRSADGLGATSTFQNQYPVDGLVLPQTELEGPFGKGFTLKVQDPEDQEIADLFLEDVERVGVDKAVVRGQGWLKYLSEDEMKDILKQISDEQIKQKWLEEEGYKYEHGKY